MMGQTFTSEKCVFFLETLPTSLLPPNNNKQIMSNKSSPLGVFVFLKRQISSQKSRHEDAEHQRLGAQQRSTPFPIQKMFHSPSGDWFFLGGDPNNRYFLRIFFFVKGVLRLTDHSCLIFVWERGTLPVFCIPGLPFSVN